MGRVVSDTAGGKTGPARCGKRVRSDEWDSWIQHLKRSSNIYAHVYRHLELVRVTIVLELTQRSECTR